MDHLPQAPSLKQQLLNAQAHEGDALQHSAALQDAHAPAGEVQEAYRECERARAEKNRLTRAISAEAAADPKG